MKMVLLNMSVYLLKINCTENGYHTTKEAKKTTIAQYEHGKKTGTWLDLTDGIVKQVTYEANKVIDVKDLKETDLAFTD